METPRERKSRDQRAPRKNTGGRLLNEATLRESLGKPFTPVSTLEILQTGGSKPLSLSLLLSASPRLYFTPKRSVNPGLETAETTNSRRTKVVGPGDERNESDKSADLRRYRIRRREFLLGL